MYKFERLEVWELSLQYIDMLYNIAAQLPEHELYNLYSQMTRAATSISLNIAEGSTGQTNTEQRRFLGMAMRSLIETVACLRLIERRGSLEKDTLENAILFSEKLFAKLASFRKVIGKKV